MEVNRIAFTKETKEKIYDNAHGKCQSCNKQIVFANHTEGKRGSWEAHHKTSVSSGGKDIASNGKALCLDCHKKTYTYGRR